MAEHPLRSSIHVQYLARLVRHENTLTHAVQDRTKNLRLAAECIFGPAALNLLLLLHCLGKFLRAGKAASRIPRHRLETNLFEPNGDFGPELSRRLRVASHGFFEHFDGVRADEGGLTTQYFVEHRPKA